MYTNNFSADELFRKGKKLIDIGMGIECMGILQQLQKYYPENYKTWLLEIMLETDNYRKFKIISRETIDKVLKLMAYDGIKDSSFDQWLNTYRQKINQMNKNFLLCNKLPPLVSYNIIQCYEPSLEMITTYAAKNQVVLVNMFFDFTMEGFLFTICYSDMDFRNGNGTRYYSRKNFPVKARKDLTTRIPELEQEASRTRIKTNCCPYCGERYSLLKNTCSCGRKKSNLQFQWMKP